MFYHIDLPKWEIRAYKDFACSLKKYNISNMDLYGYEVSFEFYLISYLVTSRIAKGFEVHIIPMFIKQI